jgi:DNA-binding FadR family transcriptional regulator
MSPEGEQRLERLLAEHEEDFRIHKGSRRGWEFYILLAELTGNQLLKVIEELLIRLFMDAEFSLSIGDVGMTQAEVTYNAQVLPANRRVADAVMSRDPARARREMTETLRAFSQRITQHAAELGRKV